MGGCVGHEEAPRADAGLAVLAGFVPPAPGQNLDEVFRKASPTVVVVRAKGRDVTAGGITRFIETGSGVLISSDSRVMTAAHVVNAKDEITVEGIGGEIVRAKLFSANAAADVSLLQLERVTKAMRVARIGDSDSVRVGERQVVRRRDRLQRRRDDQLGEPPDVDLGG